MQSKGTHKPHFDGIEFAVSVAVKDIKKINETDINRRG